MGLWGLAEGGGLPRRGFGDWVAGTGWHPYEQQKIYEEAQRSSSNDKVEGLPMGACQRRPLNEVKCKARVGYWQPRRCRWGAGGGLFGLS